MFGSVERESGRTFLVPGPDRTANTLKNVIRAWIEHGTTLISDCWAAYPDTVSGLHEPHSKSLKTLSSIRTPEIILIPSGVRGVTLRLSLDHTTGGKTTNSTSPIICSPRGVRHKGYLSSIKSFRHRIEGLGHLHHPRHGRVGHRSSSTC